MIQIEIYFRTPEIASSILFWEGFTKDKEDWYFRKFEYEDIKEFLGELIKRIEFFKAEIMISLKNTSESPNTWYFDMLSLLINGKIFFIQRYAEIEFDEAMNFTEKVEYNHIDKKYHRKAKLEKISTDEDFSPEYLWKIAWFYETNQIKNNI